MISIVDTEWLITDPDPAKNFYRVPDPDQTQAYLESIIKNTVPVRLKFNQKEESTNYLLFLTKVL